MRKEQMTEAQLAAEIVKMGHWIETMETFAHGTGRAVDSPNRQADRQALQDLRDELTTRRRRQGHS